MQTLHMTTAICDTSLTAAVFSNELITEQHATAHGQHHGGLP